MRFAIYSTDNIDPLLAADATFFDLDPVLGDYDPRFEWEARGESVATLGGRVDQDFGFNIKDRKIRIRGENMLNEVRIPLERKQEIIDGEWHFTDGFEVFRVRFSRRPRGFMANLRVPIADEGRIPGLDRPVDEGDTAKTERLAYARYRYEILLLVVSQLK